MATNAKLNVEQKKVILRTIYEALVNEAYEEFSIDEDNKINGLFWNSYTIAQMTIKLKRTGRLLEVIIDKDDEITARCGDYKFSIRAGWLSRLIPARWTELRSAYVQIKKAVEQRIKEREDAISIEINNDVGEVLEDLTGVPILDPLEEKFLEAGIS